MTDGNHVIELHRMVGSNHNAGLLVAYLPKEKILVEADGFNPPAQANAPVASPVNPNTVNLAENIARLLGATGLEVLVRLSAFILMCIGIEIIWNGYSALVGAR